MARVLKNLSLVFLVASIASLAEANNFSRASILNLVDERVPRLRLERELKRVFHAQDLSVEKVWRRLEAYSPWSYFGDTYFRSFSFLMDQKGRVVQVRCDWDDSLTKRVIVIRGCMVVRGGGPWDLPSSIALGEVISFSYEALGMSRLATVSR